MTDAPETIFVNTDDIEDGCCPVEEDEFGDGRFYSHETATKYRRADLAITTEQLMADQRVKALVDALENILSELDWTETKPFPHEVKGRNAIAQLKEPKE